MMKTSAVGWKAEFHKNKQSILFLHCYAKSE
jgi:hypothetical protein